MKLLTAPQAAVLLGVTQIRLRQLALDGTIRTMRIGTKNYRYLEDSVRDYVFNRTREYHRAPEKQVSVASNQWRIDDTDVFDRVMYPRTFGATLEDLVIAKVDHERGYREPLAS